MEGYNQDNITDSGELARDWAELIDECLHNILSRLSLKDRWLGAMRVCKPWLEKCKDPTLNSVFDLDTNFDSVTESSRFWTPEFESRIDNMILSVVGWSSGSLSEIRVRHCSNRSLSLVAQRNVRVNRLLATISSGYNQDNITDSREQARDWAELISECLRNILSRLSWEDRWLGVCVCARRGCRNAKIRPSTQCSTPRLTSTRSLSYPDSGPRIREQDR